MDRRHQPIPGVVSRQVLDSPELRECLRLLKDVVSSCYGPHGKLKVIHNSVGGHVTLTSNSQRLFNLLTLSKPALKLIVGSVQSHLRTYQDGGLFVCTLAVCLIESGLELKIHRRTVVDMFDQILGMAIGFLKSPECEVKYSLKNAGLHEMLKFTRSIITTKRHCFYREIDLEVVVQLILEGFLKSLAIDSDSTISRPENIHFLTISGFSVGESKLFQGILLDLQGRATLSPCFLKSFEALKCQGRYLSVAVVNISMAGDMEDFIDATYDLYTDVNIDQVSVKKLFQFAQGLINCGVMIVFCQKVIHPDIKRFFRENQVFVVDRLGVAACKKVQEFSGCKLIGILSETIDKSFLGVLDGVTLESVYGNNFLLLASHSSTDVSIVLCHKQEEMLGELKVVCESAVFSLFLNLQQPEVLCGGGCWQTYLAKILQTKVHNQIEELKDLLNCTAPQVVLLSNAFCNSLVMCANSIGQEQFSHMIDSPNHHLWTGEHGLDESEDFQPKTCACGKISRRETTRLDYFHSKDLQGTQTPLEIPKISNSFDKIEVYDSFPVHLNALTAAVITANSVLSISQYIQDLN